MTGARVSGTIKALYERACEVVQHDHDCPAMGGNGDADCKCDAVPFLNDFEALAAIQPDPEPQPVAWQFRWPDGKFQCFSGTADTEFPEMTSTPLFATPSSAGTVSVEAGWQPIETAPADEELILGWFNTEFMGGRWSCVVDFAHNTRGGWWHGQATHWKPLPKPPALRALAGEAWR